MKYKELKLRNNRNAIYIISIGILSYLIFFMREPSTLLHPQLWAEDGTIWYQTAYNHHFNPLTVFTPYAGYLGIFPRFIALLGGFIDLKFVPLFFNIVALFIQVLPAMYLWSRRFRKYIPNVYILLIITLLYICIPNTDEIHGTITNSQWYLAFLSFILIFIEEAGRRWQRNLERFLLLIACLSGPFSILLLPVFLYNWWRNKNHAERSTLKYRLSILTVGALTQGLLLAVQHFHHGARSSGQIGFDFTYLFQILGAQVFGSDLLGYNNSQFFFRNTWIAPVVALIGVELMLYVFIKGPTILKLLIAYAVLVLTAALISPSQLGPGSTWWGILSSTSGISRYFFIIHITVFICLVWLLFKEKLVWLRALALIALLVSAFIGIPADFVHPKLPDMKFNKYANEFDHSSRGREIIIPINPGGPFWKLQLERH